MSVVESTAGVKVNEPTRKPYIELQPAPFVSLSCGLEL
jgi:hypothetical protein